MIKIFGSTQYPKTDVSESKVIGNFPDIEPFEPYLQLEVKSWWDWNYENYAFVFDGKFFYYINLRSKENNATYHFNKRLRESDITEEYREVINNYLKR